MRSFNILLACLFPAVSAWAVPVSLPQGTCVDPLINGDVGFPVLPKSSSAVQFLSPVYSLAVFPDNPGSTSELRNLCYGRSLTDLQPNSIRGGFSDDGRIIIYIKGREVRRFDFASGQDTFLGTAPEEIPDSGEINVYLDPSMRHLLVVGKSKFLILNTETLKIEHSVTGFQASDDASPRVFIDQQMAYYLNNHKMFILDLASGRSQEILLPSKDVNLIEISLKGRRIAMMSSEGDDNIYNAYDLVRNSGVWSFEHLDGPVRSSTSVDMSSDGEYSFVGSFVPGGSQLRIHRFRQKSDLFVAHGQSGSMINGTGYAIINRDWQGTALVRLADGFEVPLWKSGNEIFGKPIAEVIGPDLYVMLNYAVLKISNFAVTCGTEKGHWNVRDFAMRAREQWKSADKGPALASLARVFSRDTAAFLQMTNELVRQPTFNEISKLKNVGLSPAELDYLEPRVKKFMKMALAKVYSNGEWFDHQSLRFLAPVIANFPESEVENFVEKLSVKFAKAINSEPQMKAISVDKLSSITEAYVLDLIGHPQGETTDLTILRRDGGYVPVILSSETIVTTPARSNYLSAGLASVDAPPLTLTSGTHRGDVLFNDQMSWRTGGKDYQSQIKITMTDPREIFEKKSPDYARMRSDQVLTGLVIFGANLGRSSSTFDEYVSFYQSRGYVFKPMILEPDSKSWLRGRITSGEVDYLVKEAHADGDEENLFESFKELEVVEGTLSAAEGRGERIYIARGRGKDGGGPTHKISNKEFGEWIRIRAQQHFVELFYLNASCWSLNKAIRELESTDPRNLINVTSLTTISTFENKSTNAMYHVVRGILESEDFPKMREHLLTIPEYRNEKDEVFIFPDEERYQRKIWDTVRSGVEFDIRTSPR